MKKRKQKLDTYREGLKLLYRKAYRLYLLELKEKEKEAKKYRLAK